MRMNRWAMLLATGAMFGAAWAQTTQPAPDAADPSLPPEQMLDRMLKPAERTQVRPIRPSGAPPETDRTTGTGAVAPGSAPLTVMREGSFIVDRIGRLTRSPDGQQMEFTFDADGRSMQDPPVILLPNLKLMMMENAVADSNRDLRFRITGVVTEYKGRNYVLLDKVVVVQDVERQF